MVPWQKPLTIPLCPKINHRYGLWWLLVGSFHRQTFSVYLQAIPESDAQSINWIILQHQNLSLPREISVPISCRQWNNVILGLQNYVISGWIVIKMCTCNNKVMVEKIEEKKQPCIAMELHLHLCQLHHGLMCSEDGWVNSSWLKSSLLKTKILLSTKKMEIKRCYALPLSGTPAPESDPSWVDAH